MWKGNPPSIMAWLRNMLIASVTDMPKFENSVSACCFFFGSMRRFMFAVFAIFSPCYFSNVSQMCNKCNFLFGMACLVGLVWVCGSVLAVVLLGFSFVLMLLVLGFCVV